MTASGKKAAQRILCLVLLACTLPGCGKQGPGGEIWKEEVRLMNGDLILIDRRNVWGGSGDISLGHGPLTDAEIRFEYKGKRYEWVQHGLWPVALQEDAQGRMYVVSILAYCWAWRQWKRPKSYYIAQSYENGKWRKVDLSKVDPGTVFNLASKSSEPGSTKPRDFVPENATKYATNKWIDEPTRKLVLSYRVNCAP